GEEQLQAEADAEKRPTTLDMPEDRLGEAGVVQLGDRVAKGADAGENEPGGVRDAGGITRDDGGVADALEALLHAPQVGHAVIDDHGLVHAGSGVSGRRKMRN